MSPGAWARSSVRRDRERFERKERERLSYERGSPPESVDWVIDNRWEDNPDHEPNTWSGS